MNEKTDDKRVEELRNRYLELKKKRNSWDLHLHRKLRFPISWTAFFIILGFIQEYIITRKFEFVNFFSSYYLNWFNSFGNFAEIYYVGGIQELGLMILRHYYYFFITGGIIALIWAIISIATHLELKKKDEFRPGQI